MSCGVGQRCGSDPTFLWLWCRPAAVVLLQPLAWEPPYAMGVAQKRQKNKREREEITTVFVLRTCASFFCVCTWEWTWQGHPGSLCPIFGYTSSPFSTAAGPRYTLTSTARAPILCCCLNPATSVWFLFKEPFRGVCRAHSLVLTCSPDDE